jgi:hypothetical protein
MRRYAFFAAWLCGLAACTTVQVVPVADAGQVKHVCIEENRKVAVADFLFVLNDGFQRHGITTETYLGQKPESCEYRVTYTATRSWDFSPYLSHAEVRIDRAGRTVGSATYHLEGGGGLSLTKWEGTKIKIDPVIDELVTGRKPPDTPIVQSERR